MNEDDEITQEQKDHIKARERLRDELGNGKIEEGSEPDTAIADVELDPEEEAGG